MAEESTANFAFQPRELSRIGLDTLEHQVELVEEAHTQAGPLVFVPDGGCESALFMTIRRETVESRRETGAWSGEDPRRT